MPNCDRIQIPFCTYSPGHQGKHPEQHLRPLRGILQTDAFNGYDRLFSAKREGGALTEAGCCWAHARRTIHDVYISTKSTAAEEALKLIGELYAIEHNVQQTLLPGACVAQIARENGINDNLLFNWRHLWRNGGLQPPGEHETSLLPVTLTPEPDNKIPAPVQIPEQTNTPSDSLCCELVLPAGTLRLKGKLTPALLQTLIREIKGSSH